MNRYRIGFGAGGWRTTPPTGARWRAWAVPGGVALAVAGLLLAFCAVVRVSVRQGAAARTAVDARNSELSRCSSLPTAASRGACRHTPVDAPN